MYGLFKKTLGPGPVYAALGNHDSYQQYALVIKYHKAAAYAFQSPGCSSCTGRRAGRSVQLVSIARAPLLASIEDIFFRNYDHVSGLWNLEQWLPQTSVDQARTHYGAYSVQRTDGLRVISLNTDMCKRHCVPRSK